MGTSFALTGPQEQQGTCPHLLLDKDLQDHKLSHRAKEPSHLFLLPTLADQRMNPWERWQLRGQLNLSLSFGLGTNSTLIHELDVTMSEPSRKAALLEATSSSSVFLNQGTFQLCWLAGEFWEL